MKPLGARIYPGPSWVLWEDRKGRHERKLARPGRCPVCDARLGGLCRFGVSNMERKRRPPARQCRTRRRARP